MDSVSSYHDHPELMTEEELFDFHHDPKSDAIPTVPTNVWNWLVVANEDRSPEAVYRRAFEARPPALGATKAQLDELLAHHARIQVHQQRSLLEMVRGQMLRMLIPCDNAEDIQDLVEILRQELDSGEPSPVPDWYKYSTVTMGPRKIGYDGCSNRSCFRTESPDEKRFSKCSQCGMAIYCSRECQVADWKARHKVVCKEDAKRQEKLKAVGRMMQNLSDLSLSGRSDNMDIVDAMVNGRNHPAVKQRRRQIRAEKKRPKGVVPEGPAPDFFK